MLPNRETELFSVCLAFTESFRTFYSFAGQDIVLRVELALVYTWKRPG